MRNFRTSVLSPFAACVLAGITPAEAADECVAPASAHAQSAGELPCQSDHSKSSQPKDDKKDTRDTSGRDVQPRGIVRTATHRSFSGGMPSAAVRVRYVPEEDEQ